MIQIRDLTQPYKVINYEGIAYGVCVDYNHISRYRNLRQITHYLDDSSDRFVTLETVNPITTNKLDVIYHVVELTEENRLDIIADKYLGSSTYSWVIAYFNKIEDGYTVWAGQTIIIPKTITALLSQGEILAPISALSLNLGEE